MSPYQQPERALSVEDLEVTVGDRLLAVDGVSFELRRGESLGLVGESGSGKTLTCRAVLGLLPEGGRVESGRITLGSGESAVDLTRARRAEWRKVRGLRLAAVFQDPGSYLNPSLTVGHQLEEVLRVRGGLDRRAAAEHALELLTEVGLHQPDLVRRQYPFQLSGGMLQRVLIAIAVSCNPDVLIADEATTALDPVVQTEILELIGGLRVSHGLSLLLVTHDLAVVSRTCDRLLVMYGGQIVESGRTVDVLERPQHPYTQALMRVASVGDWTRRNLETIPGQPPTAGQQLPGCRFAPRCEYAGPACVSAPIPLTDRSGLGGTGAVRCVRVESRERASA